MKSRPVGGCSSEIWSHPIDMNNNNNKKVGLFLFWVPLEPGFSTVF
jgi:hypothetical protein